MNVTRGDLHDWYVEGDDSAVFVGDQVLVLSPIATAILQVVGEETASLDEISEALLDRFGDPGRPVAEVTGEMLRELAEQGVVRLSDEPT